MYKLGKSYWAFPRPLSKGSMWIIENNLKEKRIRLLSFSIEIQQFVIYQFPYLPAKKAEAIAQAIIKQASRYVLIKEQRLDRMKDIVSLPAPPAAKNCPIINVMLADKLTTGEDLDEPTAGSPYFMKGEGGYPRPAKEFLASQLTCSMVDYQAQKIFALGLFAASQKGAPDSTLRSFLRSCIFEPRLLPVIFQFLFD